jgi:hypothetical protein
MKMVDNLKIIEGKKYMWDGKTYDSSKQAEETKAKYEKDGFETELLEDGGKHLVYTRRVVEDVVIEGEAPV